MRVWLPCLHGFDPTMREILRHKRRAGIGRKSLLTPISVEELRGRTKIDIWITATRFCEPLLRARFVPRVYILQSACDTRIATILFVWLQMSWSRFGHLSIAGWCNGSRIMILPLRSIQPQRTGLSERQRCVTSATENNGRSSIFCYERQIR
jgi:hypothetical protein